MYIPIVLPAAFATPLDVLGSTPTAHDSISRTSAVLVRRIRTLQGREGYAVGSGIAIAFVTVFVLGMLARCMIRERRSRQQARAHVQALAVQDREYWGVDGSSVRRIRREEDEDEGEEETEAERRMRRRQERRGREHGKFDSILEMMEKRALREEGLKESKKISDGGTTEFTSEKESSDGSKGSGLCNESDSSAQIVAVPEPVYYPAGTKLSSGGRMSLSNLRSNIS
ncbi:hypothetical protein EV426DRAFT_217208 [Tirmania nivea]|nr:hypothetical protein EV426DRAFT_217208 [Tirmania nivea]